MRFHANVPTTEAAFFEACNLAAVGEEAFVTGAVKQNGKVLIVSRVIRPAEEEVEILCMDPRGRAVSLKARRGSSEIFASAISVSG